MEASDSTTEEPRRWTPPARTPPADHLDSPSTPEAPQGPESTTGGEQPSPANPHDTRPDHEPAEGARADGPPPATAEAARPDQAPDQAGDLPGDRAGGGGRAAAERDHAEGLHDTAEETDDSVPDADATDPDTDPAAGTASDPDPGADPAADPGRDETADETDTEDDSTSPASGEQQVTESKASLGERSTAAARARSDMAGLAGTAVLAAATGGTSAVAKAFGGAAAKSAARRMSAGRGEQDRERTGAPGTPDGPGGPAPGEGAFEGTADGPLAGATSMAKAVAIAVIVLAAIAFQAVTMFTAPGSGATVTLDEGETDDQSSQTQEADGVTPEEVNYAISMTDDTDVPPELVTALLHVYGVEPGQVADISDADLTAAAESGTPYGPFDVIYPSAVDLAEAVRSPQVLTSDGAREPVNPGLFRAEQSTTHLAVLATQWWITQSETARTLPGRIVPVLETGATKVEDPENTERRIYEVSSDEQDVADQEAVKALYVEVIKQWPLDGIETRADQIYDLAYRWRLGLSGSCVPASGPVVGSGEWVSPASDVNGPAGPEGDYGPRSIGQGWHDGYDLSAPYGAPIFAASSGTVRYAGANPWSGPNHVIIDHGGGVATEYGHMQRSMVSAGQTVQAGQQIGESGNEGQSFGAHLHFGVWEPGSTLPRGYVDPVPFMAARGVTLGVTPGGQNDGAAPTPPTTPASGESQAPATQAPATPPTGTPDASGSAGLPATITGQATTGEILTLESRHVAYAAAIVSAGTDLGVSDNGIVIALMTALQETRMRMLANAARYPESANVEGIDGTESHGDSLGLFQQTPTNGWGTWQELLDADYSARAFYGGPDGVNGGSPGGLLDLTYDWEVRPKGEVAQDIQASAHPDEYDKWEPFATEILAQVKGLGGGASGCSTGGGPGGEVPGLPANCQAAGGGFSEQNLKPYAIITGRCVLAVFGPHTIGGWRPGSQAPGSYHPAGRAIDVMIDDYASPAQNAHGWTMAEWARLNASTLGVIEIIWDAKIWTLQRQDEGWRDYRHVADPGGTDDNLSHRNHVHISVSDATPSNAPAPVPN